MVRGFLAAAAVVGGLVVFSANEAQAQSTEVGPVTGTAKGIVGGGLLGAEIVMMPMGIAGLKPWWPYVVFGGVGAVGGAVGGWAVEQAAPPAEAPLYMLAGGLALVIPTLVLTLNATTKEDYGDEEDPSTLTPATEDPLTQPIPGEATPPPAAEGGGTIQIQSKARKVRKVARPSLPLALFDLAGEDVRMGVPNVTVKPLYTEAEIAAYGVEQGSVVDIPVFRTAF